MNDNLTKQQNETPFEWELRLCLAKLNKEIDLDWIEIVNILGLDIHYDNLRKKSYGYKDYYEYLSTIDNKITKILSISDTHVPFNLPVTTFEKYINKVDILQLNGDIFDMQNLSKFPKTYRLSVMEEIILGRQYIIDLIDYIKPKKISINYGNHELRFQNYLSKHLDNDILELMPETVLDLVCEDGFNHYDKKTRTKIWYKPLYEIFDNLEYTKNWHSKIGKTIFCHPKTYSSGMLKTSEKAVDFFLRIDRDFDSIIMAHVHKLGSYFQGNIALFEQGCCCQIEKLTYTDGLLTVPQQKGYIYLCQDSDGNLIHNKVKLENII